jgi:hypothetical protein
MSKEAIRSKGESPHSRRYEINSIGGNTDSGQTNALSTHNGKQIPVRHEYSGKYDGPKGAKK